jgi:hypothetical protein
VHGIGTFNGADSYNILQGRRPKYAALTVIV